MEATTELCTPTLILVTLAFSLLPYPPLSLLFFYLLLSIIPHYSNYTQLNRPSAVPLFKPHTTRPSAVPTYKPHTTDHPLFHYSNHTQPNRPSAVPLYKPHTTKQTICCCIIQTTHNQTDHLLLHYSNHTQPNRPSAVPLFNHTQPNRPSTVLLYKPHTTKQTICCSIIQTTHSQTDHLLHYSYYYY